MPAPPPDLDTATAGRNEWALPASATLAAIAVATIGLDPRVVPALYLALVTPALVVADVTGRRLPNWLVLPGFPVCIAAVVAEGLQGGQLPLAAVLAGLTYFAVFLAMAWAGGMGMGDVKLAGVLGLSAGLIGVAPAVATAVVAFVLGGVAAVVSARRPDGAGIPFGPYLLAGYWVALLLAS